MFFLLQNANGHFWDLVLQYDIAVGQMSGRIMEQHHQFHRMKTESLSNYDDLLYNRSIHFYAKR